MSDIYLIIISEQYPSFYVFAKDQQEAIDAVNRYLSINGQTMQSSSTWSVELINEAYTNDDSIILNVN